MDSFYHRLPSTSERLASQIERDPRYRVLRPLPHPTDFWVHPMPAEGPYLRIGVIDIETTGLDANQDKAIEIAIVTLALNGEGNLVDISLPTTMVEDPGHALSPEIEALTGIDDKLLKGKSFDEQLVRTIFDQVDVLVSHQAAFDRPFLIKRFPSLTHPWACSLRDIDWREFGLEGRALGHLVSSAGFHMPNAHRAGDDAWALACLLARIAKDGRTTAAHLIEKAERQTFRLFASGAPFEMRAMLKRAGYRWNADRRQWWIEGDDERVSSERVFLASLGSQVSAEVVPIDWYTRYAA